nr:cobalt ECF transporter T component CbiQ [Propionibacterium sp.]
MERLVRRLPAQVKVAALVGFALAVVAVPRDALALHAGHAVLLAAVVLAARVPGRALARGLTVEVPFVAFALFLPFVATGPRVEVLGVSLAQAGLAGAASLLVKATLGMLAAVTLASVTRPAELLDGLRRLRIPAQLVEIGAFMLRYVEVVGDEWRRMGVARAARGFVAASPAAWPALSRSVGALFLRAYERGERVHLARLARGYAGPTGAGGVPATAAQWCAGAALPAAAALVSATGLLGGWGA